MSILLNNLKRAVIALSLGLAMAGISTTSATAATVMIDFNDIDDADYDIFGLNINIGSVYTEDDFTLTAPPSPGPGFGSINTPNSVFFGSKSLFNLSTLDAFNTTTLTRSGGGAFDFLSIDLALTELISNNGPGSFEPFEIRFTGVSFGVDADVLADVSSGVSGFTSFTTEFALFTNLISVSWDQGVFDGGDVATHQFDNIVVNEIAVIPLPAALPLYGTGLAVIGLIGWRRKRKAAAQA